MKKEALAVGNVAPNAPYTPVVKAGETLYVSGQIAVGPDGKIIPGGCEAEGRQCFAQLKALLEAAGSSLDHVVKTTAFLTDLADYAVLNDLYREAFPENRPARSCFQVAALPLGAVVEIEAIAVVGERAA